MHEMARNMRAYKKAYCKIYGDQALVTLTIPKGAQVRFAPKPGNATDKNRADRAKVISIVNLKTNKAVKRAYSGEDSNFVYAVGKTVRPKSEPFDTSNNECSSGIHFFADRETAENW